MGSKRTSHAFEAFGIHSSDSGNIREVQHNVIDDCYPSFKLVISLVESALKT